MTNGTTSTSHLSTKKHDQIHPLTCQVLAKLAKDFGGASGTTLAWRT